MGALVTKSDLDSYKYVADSVKNTAVWPQFVQQAQDFDIKHWLGGALLNELITQFETSPESLTDLNNTLLDGGTYTYSSTTYVFQGLKACIIYYAFARYIRHAPINFTAAGITIKDSDFSTPADRDIISSMAKENYLMAESIKDEIQLYLSRNKTSYPLAICGDSYGEIRTFSAIGD